MAEPVKIIAEEWDLEEWLDREINDVLRLIAVAQELKDTELSIHRSGQLLGLLRVRQQLKG